MLKSWKTKSKLCCVVVVSLLSPALSDAHDVGCILHFWQTASLHTRPLACSMCHSHWLQPHLLSEQRRRLQRIIQCPHTLKECCLKPAERVTGKQEAQRSFEFILHSAPWTIKACLSGTLSMVCSSQIDTYKCIVTEQG